MIHPNDPAMPTMEHGYDITGKDVMRTTPGLTIRQEFAARETSIPPESFYREKLVEYNERKRVFRKTHDHPIKMMTTKEKVETLAAWRVLMADALIEELNKSEP